MSVEDPRAEVGALNVGNSASAGSSAAERESIAGDKGRLREAFQKALPEIHGLPASALRPITVDVPSSVATILGALPKIRAFRAQIESELPQYDLGLFDRLENYALALAYAHGSYLAASEQPRSLEELGAEATKLRDVLLLDASALNARGLVEARALAEIKNGTGYRDTAFDLVALVSLYRRHWTNITGKTGVDLGELERAEILADRLLTAVGLREQTPLKRSAAIHERLRAFALCLRAYNHARRAISYLRFDEGDAEEHAPSLYAGRMRSGSTGSNPDDEPASLPDSEAPETDAAPPAAASAASAPEVTFGKSGRVASTKVGMPGSDPFTQE